MTRKQDVLYRMFDWPQRSKVIVLGECTTVITYSHSIQSC